MPLVLITDQPFTFYLHTNSTHALPIFNNAVRNNCSPLCSRTRCPVAINGLLQYSAVQCSTVQYSIRVVVVVATDPRLPNARVMVHGQVWHTPGGGGGRVDRIHQDCLHCFISAPASPTPSLAWPMASSSAADIWTGPRFFQGMLALSRCVPNCSSEYVWLIALRGLCCPSLSNAGGFHC